MPGTVRNRQRSRTARRGGNVMSIVINAVLLYLIDAHPGWQSVSFLTPATAQVIGLVNLTLAAGIAANVLYFAADRRWLRAVGDLATLTISLITTIRIWQVFPFSFAGSSPWPDLIRALLIVAIAGTSIGIIVSLTALARSVTSPRPGA